MFRVQSALAVLLIAAGGGSATAWATPADQIQQIWKISSKAEWPPVAAATAIVLKTGNSLSAYDLKDGKKTWTSKFRSLARGPAVMAAGPGTIYVVGRRGLILLSLAGKATYTRRIKGASSVLFKDNSVYVTGRDRVLHLDDSAKQELGKVMLKSAWLRGASGRFAAVYSRKSPKKGSRLSPELLQVLDLATGKGIYQFRLLPDGAHKVVNMNDQRIAFVDYTRRDRRGKNRRKLYFTLVDYRNNKKLRDLSLSKQYASAKSDTIWITTGARGEIYLATHGKSGDDANVVGFDPRRRKTLWERLGTEPNRGVLLYDGLIWSAISDEKGAAKLVGISPTSGKAVVRLPLDSKATQAPVEVAGRIFLRTRRSVYCFAPQSKPQSPHVAATDSPTATAAAPANVDEPAAEPLVSKASAPSPAASADEPPPLPGKKSEVDADLTPQPLGQRPGWLGYRDRAIGFRIQLPRTWSLERKRIRRMGGSRAVVPFARQKEITARKFYLGTLQVLTWEAAGRDADGLWRSVYVQRKKLNPDVQVSRVHRVRNVGGKGLSGVVASYNFSGPGGQQVTLRSLCVVSHGVAFEVRAWAGPIRPRRTWKDIGEIFSSFQPEK